MGLTALTHEIGGSVSQCYKRRDSSIRLLARHIITRQTWYRRPGHKFESTLHNALRSNLSSCSCLNLVRNSALVSGGVCIVPREGSHSCCVGLTQKERCHSSLRYHKGLCGPELWVIGTEEYAVWAVSKKLVGKIAGTSYTPS